MGIIKRVFAMFKCTELQLFKLNCPLFHDEIIFFAGHDDIINTDPWPSLFFV